MLAARMGKGNGNASYLEISGAGEIKPISRLGTHDGHAVSF